MRRWGVWLAVLLAGALLLGGGMAAWRHFGRAEVSLVQTKRGPAVEAVYATGVVEPHHFTRIAPLGQARLVAVLVREGDLVRRGQVLARLDDREARAAVSQAQARRDFQRAELERQQRLVQKGFVSRQALERAEAEFRQADAQLAAAQRGLAESVLRAPIDGVVYRQDGEAGEVVGSAQALLWVGAPGALRVSAEVDEEHIARVRPGLKVLIKADAFPGQVFEGRVAEITPKGDPVNKNYRVRIALPEQTPLKVGMTTEVNIVLREEAAALLVPAEAIGNGRVWRVREGRLQPQPVQTGVRGNGQVQILQGLSDGDSVVAQPAAGFRAGDPVRLK